MLFIKTTKVRQSIAQCHKNKGITGESNRKNTDSKKVREDIKTYSQAETYRVCSRFEFNKCMCQRH